MTLPEGQLFSDLGLGQGRILGLKQSLFLVLQGQWLLNRDGSGEERTLGESLFLTDRVMGDSWAGF